MKKDYYFLMFFLILMTGCGILNSIQLDDIAATKQMSVPENNKEASDDNTIKKDIQINEPSVETTEKKVELSKNKRDWIVIAITLIAALGSIITGVINLLRYIKENPHEKNAGNMVNRITEFANKLFKNPIPSIVFILFGSTILIGAIILLPRFGIGAFTQINMYNKDEIGLLKAKIDEDKKEINSLNAELTDSNKSKAEKDRQILKLIEKTDENKIEINSLKARLSDSNKLNVEKDKQILKLIEKANDQLAKNGFVSIEEKHRSRVLMYLGHSIILLVIIFVTLLLLIQLKKAIDYIKDRRLSKRLGEERESSSIFFEPISGGRKDTWLALLQTNFFYKMALFAVLFSLFGLYILYVYANPKIYLLECPNRELVKTIAQSEDSSVVTFGKNEEIKAVVDPSDEKILFLFDGDNKMIWPLTRR